MTRRPPTPERAGPSRRADAPGVRRLSVVVPAYREEAVIASTVARLRADLTAFDPDVEVVVVDDGSDDGTAAAARDAGADLVIELAENRGKGAAVRAGVLAASGRTIAFTDADLSYSPAEVVAVSARVEEGWDVVLGNRDVAGAVAAVPASLLRRIGHHVVNRLVRLTVGDHSDTQCGLKAFRSDVAGLLFGQARIDGFGFDVEIVALADRHGLAVVPEPVRVVNTSGSTVRVVREGLRLLVDLGRVTWWLRRGAYPEPTPDVLPPRGSGGGT